MRVTAEEKERTRARILRAAGRLFRQAGYEATTTRDLATAAGVAAGTLFNYYPGKEDLARALCAAALEEGRRAFLAETRCRESLAEDLFAFDAAALRAIEPWRAIAATVLGPSPDPAHLDAVAKILARRGAAADGVAMHLYGALFVGVLSFWAADRSPGAEDTLAVLDRSTRLFAEEVLREDRDR